MKKLIILVAILSLFAATAFAQSETASTTTTTNSSSGIGLRAGLTSSPDQFHIGAHMDLGTVLPPLRLVPNVEIGFGDDITMIGLNGDLIYDFAGTPFGVGGELGLNYIDHDVAGSDTELGLSVLGDYRLVLSNGKTLLLELKVGLLDSPDFKVTAGYRFF